MHKQLHPLLVSDFLIIDQINQVCIAPTNFRCILIPFYCSSRPLLFSPSSAHRCYYVSCSRCPHSDSYMYSMHDCRSQSCSYTIHMCGRHEYYRAPFSSSSLFLFTFALFVFISHMMVAFAQRHIDVVPMVYVSVPAAGVVPCLASHSYS